MALSVNSLFGAVEPVVRKHYGLERKRKKPQFKSIFNVSSGGETVKHSMEFGGPSQLQLKTENGPVSSVSITQGPNKTWNWALYAGQITISYELAKDVKYGQIKTVAGSLGRATSLTPEYLAAQFLDRAFNSSYPATADGQELCATDHLIVGTNAANGSNMLSTAAALEEESLEDVMTNLRTMKGPDGMITPFTAEALIVPSALGHKANKLSMSDKQVGSANNDPSVVKGIKVNIFDFLDSSTRWWAKTDAPNGLFWEFDEEAEFLEDNSITTLQRVYVAFFRARWGCEDWRAIYGSNAA